MFNKLLQRFKVDDKLVSYKTIQNYNVIRKFEAILLN